LCRTLIQVAEPDPERGGGRQCCTEKNKSKTRSVGQDGENDKTRRVYASPSVFWETKDHGVSVKTEPEKKVSLLKREGKGERGSERCRIPDLFSEEPSCVS